MSGSVGAAEPERCACGWLLPKRWDLYGPIETTAGPDEELIVVLSCPACGIEHEARATAYELPRA